MVPTSNNKIPTLFILSPGARSTSTVAEKRAAPERPVQEASPTQEALVARQLPAAGSLRASLCAERAKDLAAIGNWRVFLCRFLMTSRAMSVADRVAWIWADKLEVAFTGAGGVEFNG